MIRLLYITSSLMMVVYLVSNCSMQTTEQKFMLMEDEITIEEVKPKKPISIKKIDPKLMQLLERMKTSSGSMSQESVDLSVSPLDVQSTGDVVRFNLSDTNNRPLVLVNP